MHTAPLFFVRSPLAVIILALLIPAQAYLHLFQPVTGYSIAALVLGITAVVFTLFSRGSLAVTLLVAFNETFFAFYNSSGWLEPGFEIMYRLLLIGIAAFMVTTLKRMHGVTQFEQMHFKSLVTHATEGILLIDQQGRIVLANPSASGIFGYSQEEMKGKQIENLLPENIRERHVQFREAFTRNPQNRSMGAGRDLSGLRKDGALIPLEISLGHYRQKKAIYIIAFLVDITRRKQIEQQLISKNQQLEQITADIKKLNSQLELRVEQRTLILQEALQKLEQSQTELMEALDKEKQLNEIKSRFVSMASHEFKTPLSTVLSSASLLGKYTLSEDQPKRDRHVNKIKDSVRHLAGILDDFLVYGKLEQGRVMPASISTFNIRELMETVADEMDHLKKAGQEVIISCSGSCMAASDVSLIKNIITNLLSNAIKYSKEGQRMWLHAETSEAGIIISVKDEGMGISEEDQQGLFTSFYRGTNAMNIQGTGLGLHIVRRYLDLLNGEIKVQSRLNEGSVFTVIIPNKIATAYEKDSDH